MPDDTFQLLTESDRRLLFDSARRQTYRRDEFLFHEGEAQPNLYVVYRGWVRVERHYQGRGLAVARYGPGDVVGEVSFLEQRPAQGSVIAEEDVDVDVLEGRHIQNILAADPGFASRFHHSLALRLAARLRQILPGMRLPEAFAGGAATRSRRPRTGQVSERQFPADLARGVEEFRAAMQALAAGLRDGRLDDRAAQARVNESCDAVVELLDRFTQEDALVEISMDDPLSFRDVGDLARGLGGYVFRETFQFFMRSTTIAQGYVRPRGYAEDRDLLARIEGNEPAGDGRLGVLLDRWFLGRPLCRARRNTVQSVTALLREAAGEPGPVRLTSLAAGTAAEVFGLLAATAQPLYVTCIDGDAEALLADANLARDRRCADRVTFLEADLLALVYGQAALSLGPQSGVYGLGVCDYLNDEQVIAVLDWAHGQLVPGGWLLVTNRDAASPDRAFAEHVLDWPVVHRSAEGLRGLFSRSRFGGTPAEVSREEAGVNFLARCRKS